MGELFSSSENEESDEEDDSDEEWRKTPMFKRIKKVSLKMFGVFSSDVECGSGFGRIPDQGLCTPNDR